jgi:transcription antitermination factor NusG
MAHAYTPGLKVVETALVRKQRRLPLTGEVLVEKGDKVTALDVVARTFLPGNVETVNVANKLGMPPEDIPKYMLLEEGAAVEEGQVIARMKQLFGLFTSKAASPVKGTVETVSNVTGQVIVREPPMEVSVTAYVDGEVVEVIGNEGVDVECVGTFVQGIFGIGGEVHGDMKTVAGGREDVLTAADIGPECEGKVILGGSLATAEALKKAIEVGVAGVIAGGFHDRDLRNFLGFDLGVAITGHETLGVTLVVTEGFGEMPMAEATFELLSSCEEMLASVNGATQIRAGVIRPEIIIPRPGKIMAKVGVEEGDESNLEVGSRVRVIREPYFGKLGEVTSLPVELQVLDSESRVRVLGVKFDGGGEDVIPRANVELIESGRD